MVLGESPFAVEGPVPSPGLDHTSAKSSREQFPVEMMPPPKWVPKKRNKKRSLMEAFADAAKEIKLENKKGYSVRQVSHGWWTSVRGQPW